MLEAARTITLIVIFAILDKVGEILCDSSKHFFLNIHLYNYITLTTCKILVLFVHMQLGPLHYIQPICSCMQTEYISYS